MNQLTDCLVCVRHADNANIAFDGRVPATGRTHRRPEPVTTAFEGRRAYRQFRPRTMVSRRQPVQSALLRLSAGESATFVPEQLGLRGREVWQRYLER